MGPQKVAGTLHSETPYLESGAGKVTIREISMRGFEESRSRPKIPKPSPSVAATRLERVPIVSKERRHLCADLQRFTRYKGRVGALRAHVGRLGQGEGPPPVQLVIADRILRDPRGFFRKCSIKHKQFMLSSRRSYRFVYMRSYSPL